MPTYLLIEDRRNKWEEYAEILEKQFSNFLHPHESNRYLEKYQDIQQNLTEAIKSTELDLIISDISLSIDTKDPDFFVTKMLREILDQFNHKRERQYRNLFLRKGVALVLVTQFDEHNLSTIIDRDHDFLSKYFTWSYIPAEDFEDRIGEKIENFEKDFTETPSGWYHNNHLDEYTHLLGNKIIKVIWHNRIREVRLRDVIAITREPVSSESDSLIEKVLFIENSHEVRHKFLKGELHMGLADFLEITKPHIFLNGRETDHIFQSTSETTYMLHVRNRDPFTLINVHHNWESRPRNRGRMLTLRGIDDYQCQVSFDSLNRYIDAKIPRTPRRST